MSTSVRIARYRPWKRPQPGTLRCFRCMECEATFYLARNLAHHISVHVDPTNLGNVTYWCEDCDEEFPNDKDFKKHEDEDHQDSDGDDDEEMFGAQDTLQEVIEERKMRERLEDAEREERGESKILRFKDHVIDNENLIEKLKQIPKYEKFFEINKDKSEGTLLQMVKNDGLMDYIGDWEFCVDSSEVESESDEEFPTPENPWILQIIDEDRPRFRETHSEQPTIRVTNAQRRNRNLIENFFSERSDVKDQQYRRCGTMYLEEKTSKEKRKQQRQQRRRMKCCHERTVSDDDDDDDDDDDSSTNSDEEEFLRNDCRRCVKCNCLLFQRK